MKILVCGGRDFKRFNLFHDVMEATAKQGDTVIHGHCSTGADRFADLFARRNGLNVQSFPADWLRHGKAAGPIRNQQMIDEGKPDIVIAFPGGRGTADMVSRARKAGIPVTEVPA